MPLLSYAFYPAGKDKPRLPWADNSMAFFVGHAKQIKDVGPDNSGLYHLDLYNDTGSGRASFLCTFMLEATLFEAVWNYIQFQNYAKDYDPSKWSKPVEDEVVNKFLNDFKSKVDACIERHENQEAPASSLVFRKAGY